MTKVKWMRAMAIFFTSVFLPRCQRTVFMGQHWNPSVVFIYSPSSRVLLLKVQPLSQPSQQRFGT